MSVKFTCHWLVSLGAVMRPGVCGLSTTGLYYHVMTCPQLTKHLEVIDITYLAHGTPYPLLPLHPYPGCYRSLPTPDM